MRLVERFMAPYSLRPCLAKVPARQPGQQQQGPAGPPEHQPPSNEFMTELMQVGAQEGLALHLQPAGGW
jgi:hypothetical protein